MVRASFLALLLFLMIPFTALAGSDYIGLFADPDGTRCHLALEAGVLDTLHVLAILPDYGVDGITAAEFAIEGLPENGPGGIWLPEWASDLTLGDAETGIAVAFQEPVMGGIVELGRIIFMPNSADWVGADHGLRIVEPLFNGSLALVTHEYQQIPVPGEGLLLNCGDPGYCPCEVPACSFTPEQLDFGPVSPGGFADLDFTLSNASDDTIPVEFDIGHPYFELLGSGNFELGFGESATVTLRFAPEEIGLFETVLDTGSDCGSLVCTGTGANICSIYPENPVDLGEVAIGDFQEAGFQVANAAA
jgi:hypothetical protein